MNYHREFLLPEIQQEMVGKEMVSGFAKTSAHLFPFLTHLLSHQLKAT